MFEAGALSKHSEEGRVSPVLFDGLRHEDLKGPLGGFQAVLFGEIEFRPLIESINGRCGLGRLSDGVLEDVFKTWWPRLETRVNQIMREYRETHPAQVAPERVVEETLLVVKSRDRDIRLALEMLQELLALNRHSKPGKVRTTELDSKALTDLVERFLALKNAIAASVMTEDEKIRSLVCELAIALKRFVTLGIPDENLRRDLGSKLDGVHWDLVSSDQNWGASG